MTLEEQGKLADLGAKHEKSSVAVRIRHCTLSLLQWTVCDEEGKQLFTAEDLTGLMSKSSASAFLRLQDAVLKLSGLTEESRRELETNLADRADRGARFSLALELGPLVGQSNPEAIGFWASEEREIDQIPQTSDFAGGLIEFDNARSGSPCGRSNGQE